MERPIYFLLYSVLSGKKVAHQIPEEILNNPDLQKAIKQVSSIYILPVLKRLNPQCQATVKHRQRLTYLHGVQVQLWQTIVMFSPML